MHAQELYVTARRYVSSDQSGMSAVVEESLELAKHETTFVMVDVYGRHYDDDYAFPPGTAAFYRPPEDDPSKAIVRERIAPAKAAARCAGLRRLYLANYLSPGLSAGNEWRNLSVRTCGVDVLEAWRSPTTLLDHSDVIAPEADEPVIRKQLYSGFFETHLDSVLRAYGTRNLVVVGFDSRLCLGTTVADAMYRGYRVVVLRDAVHTLEFDETREGEWANFIAIRFIEENVGFTATTDEFVRACRESMTTASHP